MKMISPVGDLIKYLPKPVGPCVELLLVDYKRLLMSCIADLPLNVPVLRVCHVPD